MIPSPSDSSARQPVRAARGSVLSCKGWEQEAALRMLMNCLDPEVAERPEEMIVCGGAAGPVRDWESLQQTLADLRALKRGEALLVPDGIPAIATQLPAADDEAPRVTMAWDSGEAAVSGWIYTGSQGPLVLAYETLGAAARRHFGGTLGGRLVASGGMGGAGGAMALAATLRGAAFLGIEADPERIKRRLKSGYVDVMVNDLDEALRILKNAVRKREPASVGLVGNCAEVIPALALRGVVPDLLTDQTAARDPADYIAAGLSVTQAAELQRADERGYRERAMESIAAHVRGMLELRKLGSVVFEFGNGIFARAATRGVTDAERIPDFAEEYLTDALGKGCGLVQWVALSGEPADVARADQLALSLFPEDTALVTWLGLAKRQVRFQGFPARAAWMTRAAQRTFAEALHELVRSGEVTAPMVVTREEIEMREGAPGAPEEMPDSVAAEAGRAEASWILSRAGRTAAWAIVADGNWAMGERLAPPVRSA